jgi:aerobic carbon-monoxide dehydrogenase medium subunit
VLVPGPAAGATIVHQKFVLHERPAINVACHLRVDGDRLADVRLAVGSAGVRAARATAAEEQLAGVGVGELREALEQAGELVADAAQPVKDANGSVEYKRNLAAVLSARAVRAAVAEARAGDSRQAAPSES